MKIQFVYLPVVLIILTAVVQPGSLLNQEINAPPDSITGMGNPAAVHCQDLGYEFKTVPGPDGARGICEMPDGEACGAWAFLQGECGQDHSWCAQQGLSVETRSDGKNPYSQKYAVCLDEKGKEVGAVHGLSNLPEKALGCGGEVESRTAPDRLTASTADSENLDGIPPADFDWRNHNGGNWLTPIRNQAQCGSCWAFSAVGVAESALNIAANNPDLDPDLSEQFLVSDCYDPYNDLYQNCCGGFKGSAIQYIRDSGIPDEGCFSYVDGTSGYDGSSCTCYNSPSCGSGCQYSADGSCSDTTCGDRCSNWDQRLETIEEYGRVGTDQTKIKNALINYGPLAVSLDMGGEWDGDIFRCSEEDGGTNHAVIIVGYTDDASQETGGYWIVRNSWGTGWIDGGYFKVGFNECSIEQYVYYATSVNNQPPDQPSSPIPTDGSIKINIEQDLDWAGGDPDSGDTVTYDVFLESDDTSPDQLICDDVASESCDPGTLDPGKTYYWQVTAFDNQGYRTDSPVWQFETKPGDTVGLYDPDASYWYLKPENVGDWNDVRFKFGKAWAGRIGITGDWDGDGIDTIGLYDPSDSYWILSNSNDGSTDNLIRFKFGPVGDNWLPITGDWDGDGMDNVGLFDPDGSYWYLKPSFNHGWDDFRFKYGSNWAGRLPVVGDWNGDGIDTVGMFDPTYAAWMLKNENVGGSADLVRFKFGRPGDNWLPVAGDWNGDGSDRVGLFDPDAAYWYLKPSLVSGWDDARFKYGQRWSNWDPNSGKWGY